MNTSTDQSDTATRFFYVTARRWYRGEADYRRIRGPFAMYSDALDALPGATAEATTRDPRGDRYEYGISCYWHDHGPGALDTDAEPVRYAHHEAPPLRVATAASTLAANPAGHSP